MTIGVRINKALQGFVALALLRLGTHWVPFCLGASAPFSVFFTQKYSEPAYATTEPAHTSHSGHTPHVGHLMDLSLFVPFVCESAVPHGGLILIFRLGTPTARSQPHCLVSGCFLAYNRSVRPPPDFILYTCKNKNDRHMYVWRVCMHKGLKPQFT